MSDWHIEDKLEQLREWKLRDEFIRNIQRLTATVPVYWRCPYCPALLAIDYTHTLDTTQPYDEYLWRYEETGYSLDNRKAHVRTHLTGDLTP